MMGKDFDVANLGIRIQVDFNIFKKCGGTHEFSCHIFKCYKCREKRHVVFLLQEGSDVFSLSLAGSSQTQLCYVSSGGSASPNILRPTGGQGRVTRNQRYEF